VEVTYLTGTGTTSQTGLVSSTVRGQAGEAGHSTGATSASALATFLSARIQVCSLGLKLVRISKQLVYILRSGERGCKPSGPFGEIASSVSLVR
jgi:hypothetical protein